jgi:plastocyanin
MRALLVLAVSALALGVSAPAPATGGRAAAHVQIVARDFSYSLSRVQLRSGATVVELMNLGQDAHDLRLQRVGARHIAGTPVVSSGDRAELSVRLAPGRYQVWCSVADHRARGMAATLVVKRRGRDLNPRSA